MEIARKHGAVVVLDDAHGLGAGQDRSRRVRGQRRGKVDILIGTFSKSFGTVGGFVCADQSIIDYIKMSARGFPVFRLAAAGPGSKRRWPRCASSRRATICSRKLEENARFFRAGSLSWASISGESTTHISPIFIRDEMKTLTFGAYLFHAAEVVMMPFVSPGVAKGKSACAATSPPYTPKSRWATRWKPWPCSARCSASCPATARRVSRRCASSATSPKSKPPASAKTGLYLQHELGILREARQDDGGG